MMPSSSCRFAAIVVTGGAIVLNFLALGRAVMALNIGLLVALLAWLMNNGGRRRHHRLVGPLFLAMIAVQSLHFVEEYTGRLYETAPPLFGLTPLPEHRFVIFNVAWIVVFLVAAVGIFRGHGLSLVAVWFMALVGGIGNALFHSWLAIRGNGSPPGVATSLINLPIGIVLVVLLSRSGAENRTDERDEDRLSE